MTLAPKSLGTVGVARRLMFDVARRKRLAAGLAHSPPAQTISPTCRDSPLRQISPVDSESLHQCASPTQKLKCT
jgi:hypothetical protein